MTRFIRALVVVAVVTFGSMSAAQAGSSGVGLFAGFKTLGGSSHFTLGAEAEFSLFPMFGLALFAEQGFAAPAETDLGIGLSIRPVSLIGLKFIAAPGVSLVSGTSTIFGRAGVAYEFGIGPLHIGPAFNVDFSTHGTALVYGLVAGVGF